MDARMIGKPTLMAVYPHRYEAAVVLDSIGKVSYPLSDVSVLYRLRGTDHVVDAVTGHVAAGQSISDSDLTPALLKEAETVVILHPDDEVAPAVRAALEAIGDSQLFYEGASDVAGAPGGYVRQDDVRSSHDGRDSRDGHDSRDGKVG